MAPSPRGTRVIPSEKTAGCSHRGGVRENDEPWGQRAGRHWIAHQVLGRPNPPSEALAPYPTVRGRFDAIGDSLSAPHFCGCQLLSVGVRGSPPTAQPDGSGLGGVQWCGSCSSIREAGCVCTRRRPCVTAVPAHALGPQPVGRREPLPRPHRVPGMRRQPLLRPRARHRRHDRQAARSPAGRRRRPLGRRQVVGVAALPG